ncbi:MAG TPA: AMP-binding protein, partial [Puia sp.]|nr:AMP-binding protein [Puia sp.]
LEGDLLREKLYYWKQRLEGVEPLQLPADYTRPAVQSTRGAGLQFKIDAALAQSLQRLSLQEGASLYMMLLAVFQVLLHRYSGQEDIAVGSPIAGRQQQETEGLIGFFINTLVLRSRVSDGLSFRELLGQVKEATLGAFAHQEVPFEKVVEVLSVERDRSRGPLVDVKFALHNMPPSGELDLGPKVNLKIEEHGAVTAQVAISVDIMESAEGLWMGITYCTDLYKGETMRRMAGHYIELLHSVVADAGESIGALRMLGDDEERQLREGFNATDRTWGGGRTVLELFAGHVRQHPGRIAVRSEVRDRVELWPSVAEFFVYDGLLYRAMLQDHRRNRWYAEALSERVHDKVVVEIGPGPEAILSRLSIEAGARKVYAIELLEDAYRKAKRFVEEAGLADRIMLIHGDAMKVELPELADVCISELVGPIGGSEGAAVILNNARRLLKQGGGMIPGRNLTRIAPVSLPDYFAARPGFSETGGVYVDKVFDYLGHPADIRLRVRNFPHRYLLSEPGVFEDLDFRQGLVAEQSVHRISFDIGRDDLLQGFLVWLTLESDGTVLDTLEHEYCWLPVFVPVFYPGVAVAQGDRLEVEVERRLSANGINPDFHIRGYLRQAGGRLDFDYSLPHEPERFREHAFYQQVFDEHGHGVVNGKEKVYETMSYAELHRQSDRLSGWLRQQGMAGGVVAVWQDSSIWTVSTLLAILKASALYLPIDPQWPMERIASIWEESKPAGCITARSYQEQVEALAPAGAVLMSRERWEHYGEEGAEAIIAEPPGEAQGAYIIYTSGSTGRPKGVVIAHRGLLNLTQAQIEGFGIGIGDRVLQFASLSFDASISEIFTTLCAGAELVVYDRQTFSAEELFGVLRDQNIGIVTLPPSVLRILPSEGLTALHTVVSAGEACDGEIVKQWRPGRRFINAYGPTEYTVCTTMNEVGWPEPLPVSIGRPIANTRLWVLGGHG